MTPNKEDYLKIMYELGGSQRQVSNKEIAEALNVSAASVSEMLQKLLKGEYITYIPYKGVQLSRSGIKEAVELVRKHRLWEVFLVRHLGYSWSEVHEDAELLEHVTPPRLLERLDTFLQHPTACPHGGVIPQENQELEPVPTTTLDWLTVGESGVIRRVVEDRELLEYLERTGLGIGDRVTVRAIGAYEGPFTLEKGEQTIQISYKAACHIYVGLS